MILPIDCSGVGLEQYSLAGSTSCSQCPAGNKCISKTDAPIACQTGEYAIAGAMVCTPCPAGKKCPTKTALPIDCSGTGLE
jgi:hypothetical protein